MKISCFNLLFFFSSLPALSQSLDTLDASQIKSKLSLINHAYYLAASATTPIDSIASFVRKFKNIDRLSQFNFGYNDTTYWLLIPIKNIQGNREKLLIEIQNPHIDRIQTYCIGDSKIIQLGQETGDFHAFSTRYIQHRNFIWPLNDCGLDNFTLAVRIEKRKSSLNIPAFIWTESAHRNKSTLNTLFFGISFGMMILVSIYSLAASVFLKTRIYFLYALFIITSIVFLATFEGLSFQVLYPTWGNFNSLFRMLINGLTTITFILFSKHFLKIKTHSNFLNQLLNSIIIIFIILLSVTPFLKSIFFTHGLLMIPIILSLSGIANISLFFGALKFFSKQKSTSLFFLIAYSAILVSGVLLIMEDFGWIEVLPFSLLFVGVLIEMLVFSLALTFLMKKVYDERNNLIQKLHQHQKQMMQSYVLGVEKERERIAGELHDDVGSRLSNLRRLVTLSKSENKAFIENEIIALSEDVRNLSHQKMPIGIRYKGLPQLVTDLIAHFKKNTEIKFMLQCYDFPEKIPEHEIHQLYRIIQEGLNNIAKHSRASEADIQLFGYDQELIIAIEDNGIGLDLNLHKGLGLTQMKARTEALNGKLEINSSANYGTSLLITIPFVEQRGIK